MTDEFRGYRRWFYAAAIYNAGWGTAVVLFPRPLLQMAGMTDGAAVPLAQVIGMMVGVYAYGYYLLAREPLRYSGLIWIALAGKTLGPLGFLYSVATGALPWSFGWICVFNDVIWWPVFWRFALKYGRAQRDAVAAYEEKAG
jgi:small multidrug resistance pump